MSQITFSEFSTDLKQHIERRMQELLDKEEKPYAVFDADGTLWHFDLGETLFQYEIDQQLVSLPKEPMAYYNKMKAENPRQAYLWLAQIHEGIHLETVREWAHQCVKDYGEVPIFPSMKELIEKFQKWNVEVFVVTASIRWAVEPGAKLLGIPKENVIGIETEIDNGLITSKQKGPITYQEGKAKAFFHTSQGIPPIFAAGNTMGDFALLNSSKGMKLCIQSAHPNEENYQTEQELRSLAVKHQWLHHAFL